MWGLTPSSNRAREYAVEVEMYYHIKGLVLKSQISAEADKIITVYTHEWGKISAVVPGAKKIKAKLAWAAEPIRENEFLVYAKNGYLRPKVTGAKAINSFTKLFCDWRRFSIAQYCAEIMDVLTPFNSENARKYELLSRTWNLLETSKYPWRIFSAFVLRFLNLSGYSFTEFLKRNKHLVNNPERELIGKLSNMPGEDVDKLFPLESRIETNIKQAIDSYLSMYLPRKLCSKEFCEKIIATE
ncbi:MAG: DNA repair protein RecO [Elusimicrobia bacterium]|nr:DNA repair protein RecO [Elusimicrobiota bacterium]